ncbi:phosphomannomutase/phosphoglucomutase [Aquicella lusitana]|uniref:phosphomannomutase n=1 Tax=Aquicella lusitana TaxID=254246 RepID=A0A370GMS4_9COXI|nr:phosphomannomutase/phosphoglucomutase [Aquicella lusitana]RDI44586.1 phosphomannomutase/phosphoglucomutase [Aquicella lusitana]VVC72472.1 Phosphomannomutase/phosphoglucomutase [Aquicella lusitana]
MLAAASVTTLPASIFRAYDIRGIVGETLTEEIVFLIGKAVGSLVRERGENQICIARDGRLSGPSLLKALSEGILSSGCDVMNIGMAPTPLLYYATHVFEGHSGIMLTGSHNPPDYNGLKIVVQNTTLAEEQIEGLYQRIITQRFSNGSGTYREVNIVERYIREVTQGVQLARPLNIVIDAGNGVTGMIAPALFRALGCKVHELFCEVDGTFPHHHPDPSQPENLRHLVKAVHDTNADIGLAFDGDGDRLGVVTCSGDIIFPDRLLILFAQALLSTQPNAKVIYDVKCTNHLDTIVRALQGEPIMWKTGHSLIKAKMAETRAELGGEMSGHFFFKDRWYGFDDALYAGARLLEIIAKEKNSDLLFSAIPNSVNTTELKVWVSDEEKFELMQQLIASANFDEAKDIMTIDGLRVNFAEGWGLVRPSNTTPYLILRFEALNQAILEKIQLLFREWMLSVKPDLVLPF